MKHLYDSNFRSLENVARTLAQTMYYARLLKFGTIPLGWNERGTSGETEPIKTNSVPEHQTFIITPDGTLSVIKAGYYVSRGTNTQIRSGRVQR